MNDLTTPFIEEYPFEPHYLNLNGLRYHYVDEGSGTDAIVMVHGNPTWSFYYRNLIKRLSKSFRVICPDHIGCGLSDKPQDYAYRLENHIENLFTLVEHLQLTSIQLVLHDWGGAIGMGVALKMREKVKKITVLNTAAFLSPHIPLRINICRTPILGKVIIQGFNGFAAPAIFMACTQKEQMTAMIKKGYLAPYNNWKNRIATYQFVQDIPMHSQHPTWAVLKKIEDSLKEFQEVPLAIFWGKRDFCFNDHFLKRWKEFFPKAPVTIYDKAGHYVLEDAKPMIIDDIERWVKENGCM